MPFRRRRHDAAARDVGRCLGNPRYFRVCFLATAATPPRLKNGNIPCRIFPSATKVALANRMLANEGVLDAFGHVNMRHPADPGRYLLSRSRSPALIEADDILEFTLDYEPVERPTAQLYAERVIHGCIYRAAGCDGDLPPSCAAGDALIPVIHVAAIMGDSVPF